LASATPERAADDSRKVFNLLGAAYAPFLQGVAVLLVLWLILFWMYRRKLFLRI
jgi:predicted acyltransferase